MRRPNRSDISTFHCSNRGPAGETMRMRWTSRRAVSSVSTRPVWQVLPRPTPSHSSSRTRTHADRPQDRHELVGLDAEAARLDGQQGIGPEGLFQEERLVVDQPVHQRRRPIRPEVVADRLDHLEGVEDVEFLPEDGVFQPAQPEEGLRAEALAGYHLPAQPAGMDFGSRQQFQRAGGHDAVRFPDGIDDAVIQRGLFG